MSKFHPPMLDGEVYGADKQTHKQNKQKTSTTPSCSGPIPAQKSRCKSVLGVLFSDTMPKMDFHYSHRFS